MKLQLTEISQAVQGVLLGTNQLIEGAGIDTRTLNANELYIALKGKNFDGHDFIANAKQAGAAAVLVERRCETELPQILVKNSRLALAELAGFWRTQLPIKLVGITGSNGKTTTKEMLAAILATQGNTLLTQGNLNNDIGVPLTLLKLNAAHHFAVIEMGANHAGEIAYTSRYAKADVSLITNIAAAHIEGFGDLPGVASSKGEIITSLSDEGIAVLNHDDAFYPFWLELAGKRKTISFGLNQAADIFAKNIGTQFDNQEFTTLFELQTPTASISIQLRLAGEHNVKNALAAAAAALQFGVSLPDIKQGLEQVKPVIGRLQPLRGRKGNLIIDDTYNANPASLQAALDALDSRTNNWLILGAFGELGNDSSTIHREMGELIKTKPVQRLFATGELARQTVQAFGHGGEFFENQEQLIFALNQTVTGKETLLVKGSRAQKMENVVAAMVDNFRAA